MIDENTVNIINRLEQIIELMREQAERDKQLQSLIYKSYELQEKMLKDLNIS